MVLGALLPPDDRATPASIETPSVSVVSSKECESTPTVTVTEDDCGDRDDHMDISLDDTSPDEAAGDDDDIFSEKAMSGYEPVCAALSNETGRSVKNRSNNRPMVARLSTGQRRNSVHPSAEKFNGPGEISPLINRCVSTTPLCQ